MPKLKKKCIMAIDPGKSGGIAWKAADEPMQAVKMPEGMTGIVDFIYDLDDKYDVTGCYLEKVGQGMPGQSSKATATFARHCGHLEAALYSCEIPVNQITPAKWMKALCPLPKGAENKTARKNAIKEEVQRRYPHLKVTLAMADALGIYEAVKELIKEDVRNQGGSR